MIYIYRYILYSFTLAPFAKGAFRPKRTSPDRLAPNVQPEFCICSKRTSCATVLTQTVQITTYLSENKIIIFYLPSFVSIPLLTGQSGEQRSLLALKPSSKAMSLPAINPASKSFLLSHCFSLESGCLSSLQTKHVRFGQTCSELHRSCCTFWSEFRQYCLTALLTHSSICLFILLSLFILLFVILFSGACKPLFLIENSAHFMTFGAISCTFWVFIGTFGVIGRTVRAFESTVRENLCTFSAINCTFGEFPCTFRVSAEGA